jgi:hypothetical protein
VDDALLDISDRMAKAERFFPARERAQAAAAAAAAGNQAEGEFFAFHWRICPAAARGSVSSWV